MDQDQYRELMEAIERNTSATRSISVLLLGAIPWVFAGAAGIFIGSGLVGLNSGNSSNIGAGLIVVGSILILFGAIRSIALALGDLKKSRRPTA